MLKHKIDYSEMKYKSVASLTVDTTGGTVIPNGQKIAVTRVRCNGASPDIFVSVVWDYGGASEKYIISTKSDADVFFDSSNLDIQFIGDGTKAMKVIITNNLGAQSPVVGGAYELTII